MTPKAYTVLGVLIAAGNASDPDYEDEIVRERRSCWIGSQQVSPVVLDELLRLVALRDVADGGKVERYRINDVGRALHRNPGIEADILRCIASGGSFTVQNDEVVEI